MNRRSSWIVGMCVVALSVYIGTTQANETEWKVGVASTIITPETPTWLSGYGDRDKPAEGKIHDLYAKALAFESKDGERLVWVTCDLGSVYQGLTDAVEQAVEKKCGLAPGRLVINVSHTHCAPEVAIERIVFHSLSDDAEAKLAAYIEKQLIPKLIDLVVAAVSDLSPSRIYVSGSEAHFGKCRRLPTENGVINSRNDEGVTEDEVPVMQVVAPDGKLRALVFGHACHNTTLAFYQYCGDYAGFAQHNLEKDHPGTVALFMMGCGGDQNPYPRHGERGLEYCQNHGRELSNAVERALKSKRTEVHGPLRVASETVTLELEPLPDLKILEQQAAGGDTYPNRKARYLLKQLKEKGKIDLTQTCPLLAAKFGNELLFVAVSGETVIDYSRMPKREFAGPMVWVAGYCNDVFAYLPSQRVLIEGGYEGRTGIVHQLVPTPFLPNVEEIVMGGIRRLVAEVSAEK